MAKESADIILLEKDLMVLEEGIKDKLNSNKGNFKAGVLKCGAFTNEAEIVRELHAESTETFFEELRKEVTEYYA